MRGPASALAPLLLLLGGCTVDDGSGFDEARWSSELLEYRERKDERLRTSSTSPMAGTQYLKSRPGDRVWLVREGETFRLAHEETPGAGLFLALSDGAWEWTAGAERVNCRVGDRQVDEGTALAGPALFLIDDSPLSFYPGEDRVTFIVFDPDRPEKIAFDHLLYFPPDASFVVDARLERFAQPEEVEMATSRNLIKTFFRYARIRFELAGEEQVLTAFKSALSGANSTGLFVPFRDATSGRESYGAGRFLELDEPDGDEIVLDFNRCFNPLCNYSPAYNCAVPPRENHLDVAVRAGERTYPH
ncbi:MAG: DUF1684 domain-containing protein [bacterium]|nr:DUF1684 domain-containing protein [bacterium]